MSVEPVVEPTLRHDRVRAISYDPYQTICGTCGGEALSYGGGSLWCWTCLEPLIRKGQAFKPSIVVKRA